MCARRSSTDIRRDSPPAEMRPQMSTDEPRPRRGRAGRRTAQTVAFVAGTHAGPVSGVIESLHPAHTPISSPALPAVIISSRLIGDDPPLVTPAPPITPPTDPVALSPTHRPTPHAPSRVPARRGWIPVLGLVALATSILLVTNHPLPPNTCPQAENECGSHISARAPTTTLVPPPALTPPPKPEPTALATEPTPRLTPPPKPEPTALATEPTPTLAPAYVPTARAHHIRPTPPRSDADVLAKRYDAIPPKAAAHRHDNAPLETDAHRHDNAPFEAAKTREANRTPAPVGGAPRIYLQTRPAGAEIWLFGQLRGKSPMSLDLDGPVEVTLKLPEYQTTHVTLAPADGSRWLSVPLDPR